MEQQEQRRFARTATNVQAFFRPMASPDEPQLFKETISLESQSKENPFADGRMSEAVASFLLSLDQKLDALIGMMSQNRLENDFPVSGTVTEISGAGLRFVSEQQFQTGAVLEAVLLLRQLPPSMAGAVGRVMRADAQPKTSLTEYSMDFVRIREHDLEAIVQFVFHEERSHIRERKWD